MELTVKDQLAEKAVTLLEGVDAFVKEARCAIKFHLEKLQNEAMDFHLEARARHQKTISDYNEIYYSARKKFKDQYKLNDQDIEANKEKYLLLAAKIQYEITRNSAADKVRELQEKALGLITLKEFRAAFGLDVNYFGKANLSDLRTYAGFKQFVGARTAKINAFIDNHIKKRNITKEMQKSFLQANAALPKLETAIKRLKDAPVFPDLAFLKAYKITIPDLSRGSKACLMPLKELPVSQKKIVMAQAYRELANHNGSLRFGTSDPEVIGFILDDLVGFSLYAIQKGLRAYRKHNKEKGSPAEYVEYVQPFQDEADTLLSIF